MITGLLPASGSPMWYDALLKLLESRQITKIDKAFLENQDPKIASGNESTLIAGLKFLGLVDKDGNAKEAMSSLSLKGEKRKENLEKVVRTAYSLLFDEVKLNLAEANADTLTNCFKIDYKMGSLTTAERASRVFVFLAQQAGIPLSESIAGELGASRERKATTRKPREPNRGNEPKSPASKQDQLSEEVLARFTLKDVGSVDIKDEDTFGLAKAFFKVLAKKLGIPE